MFHRWPDRHWIPQLSLFRPLLWTSTNRRTFTPKRPSSWIGPRSLTGRNVMERTAGSAGSVDLGAGEPDHFRPFCGVFGNEPRKFGRRAGKGRVASICKARPHPRIGEAGRDLLVELVDDLGGRASGSAHPLPAR